LQRKKEGILATEGGRIELKSRKSRKKKEGKAPQRKGGGTLTRKGKRAMTL